MSLILSRSAFRLCSIKRHSKLTFRSTFSTHGGNNKPNGKNVTDIQKTSSLWDFKKAFVGVNEGLKHVATSTVDMIKNPKETWQLVKDTAHHYWFGSKLLWAEIKMAYNILKRVLQGSAMTRRERLQLIRTTMDIFRLVPFAIFVIVPFMEFLLPFALKLFPNMLPSTFQDELKKEESMKKELQMRLAVAGFLQETLQEMASKQEKSSEAKEVIKFIEKARHGEPLPNESVIRIAQLFKDEFTLANIPRPQLVSMCQYMNLHPYGADTFLRFQLRNKFRVIKEDDRRILWEGIESLSIRELREACQERGMRAHGLEVWRYSKQLKEWLDLSIQKSIPISLLIMSRAFTITQSTAVQTEDVLRSSMSSFDSDTINEIVLAVASPAEEDTLDMRKRKLDSLQFQKEMMEEELEEKTEAKLSAAQSKRDILKLNENKSEKVETISIDSKNQTQAKQQDDELSAAEIEAISELTASSAVQREKAKLAILQANMDAVQASSNKSEKKTSTSLIDANLTDTATEQPIDDKASTRLTSLLSSMVDKLKTQIDNTEKALGSTLHQLDLDGDGHISAGELKEAIRKILKRSSSEKEIEDFFKLLDKDSDGKVTVAELIRFAEDKRRTDSE